MLLLLSILCTSFRCCNYLVVFTMLTTFILTLYWFQILFPFCHCFFLNSMLSFFGGFSSLVQCHFSLFIASWLSQLTATTTARNVSKNGVFSGPYFPVLGLNTGKYGPGRTPYLDTFHTVSRGRN